MAQAINKTGSDRKLKLWGYTLLFMFNAAGMILELLASRAMSPYFGNSNYVWTAIIGIILLAGSIGNLIGGRLCLRPNRKDILAVIVGVSGMYISLIPALSELLLPALRQPGYSIQVFSVIAAVLLFLLPSAGLGVLTPVIMKEMIDASPDSGNESGHIHAVIAIGSLVGTFAGGFFLIPAIGTKLLLGFLGIICAIMGFAVNGLKNSRTTMITAIFAVLAVSTVISMKTSDADPEGRIASIDTEYGRIIVEDAEYEGCPIRLYRQSGAYSSATYLDEDKKYELVFEYMGRYEEAQKNIDVKNTLMIGGAAYQYPKYFISHHPGQSMDVVEIDGMAEKIARRYFFLDDLIEEYDIGTSGRLSLITDDGRMYLSETEKKYDAIFNDAFTGEVPVAGLATVEAAELVKSRLNPGGVYMSNVIGAISGKYSRFIESELLTLEQVFDYVCVMLTREGTEADEKSNYMIIASDTPYEWDNLVSTDTSGAVILTDDYCPVENLAGIQAER